MINVINKGVKGNDNLDVPDNMYDAKVNAHDIVFSMMRKVGGKRIHVDVSSAQMDKVTFHPEISGHKWKYSL
ncbi:hypothetical protein KIW84_056899 [Lathyrus oleraceus]|uniref:Uncharacterized protein n=1 Tax=Pisum sativum TaxID=3888 RepID=A0A9D4X1Q5_PEA|nr:hypothetical protein KIW84_056899 [Pisum sativum]